MAVRPVNLHIVTVKDRLVGGKEPDDAVGAAPVIRNDPEPGESRSLQLGVQESVDPVFRPQVKELVRIGLERAFIPSCMIF